MLLADAAASVCSILGAVKLTRAYKDDFANALNFAESLAPARRWLSRHSVPPDYDLTGLEEWVETKELRGRTGWSYLDYRKAWACTGVDYSTGGVRVDNHTIQWHTGAIAKGYTKPNYCCYYLSILRTWDAVMSMPVVMAREEEGVT